MNLKTILHNSVMTTESVFRGLRPSSVARKQYLTMTYPILVQGRAEACLKDQVWCMHIWHKSDNSAVKKNTYLNRTITKTTINTSVSLC